MRDVRRAEAEAYVRPGDVGQLMADHLMAAVNPANVWLHVVDRPLPRPARSVLVIADLADHDRAREVPGSESYWGSPGDDRGAHRI